MKIKVCGLSNPNEVQSCVEDGVNYCGFILNYKKSHRFISFERAKILTSINKKNTSYVGVLVKPSNEELKIYSKLNLDYFQLYGEYSSQEISSIKNEFKKKIIYSIQVKNRDDIQKYKEIEKSVDIILWDSSGFEKSISWDYNWLKLVKTNVKKMIAGNITIEKLYNLKYLADIVDVSGALETNKVKDIGKIKNFVSEIRRINDAN